MSTSWHLQLSLISLQQAWTCTPVQIYQTGCCCCTHDTSHHPCQCWMSCASGAAALAPCLHRLEEVNLSDCGICAQGATALAVPVAAPSSRLRCLRLEQNDIGHEGAEAIASAAASSPCLEELYLGGCAIGDAGDKTSDPPTLSQAPSAKFCSIQFNKTCSQQAQTSTCP